VSVLVGNGKVRLEIEPEHGRIISLRHSGLDIELIGEPRLAENFRILLPLPGRRGHYIRGAAQRLADAQVTGDSCRLIWRGLSSEHGWFDIEITQSIRLDGDDVIVQTEAVNRCPHEIEEVSSVVLAGLANTAERDDWRIHYAGGGGQGQEWDIYDTFPGSYLGPAKPVWAAMYPTGMSMPWAEIYHAKADKGFYFGNHDPQARHSVLWAEFTPCTTHGGPKGSGQYWPDPADLDGEPSGLSLAWVSLPFLAPGHSWAGPPVTIHFHRGGWWEAARHFRAWSDTLRPIDKAGNWLAEEDAWQSTIISYPDGTVRYRFSDLPKMAMEARDAGINVLQIDGWDIGGIDRDYPQYTPDPRLGTWEELVSAVAECQGLGVKVMLFTNLQWVNVETDWYERELHRYVVRDPDGHIRGGMGWEYNTTLGLLGQTVKRMVMVNPGRPEFKRVILDQLQNVARLGAAGTQIDKFGALGDVDFSADNPLPRGDGVPAGTLAALAEFYQQARQELPGFCIASEAHWDRIVPYVDASYSRFFTNDHLPTFGVAFPEYRQSCCITGDYDYGLVNNCLRYGHIINVEAECLHGTAADAPHLSAYVAEALRLRRSLKHRIWHSRLADPGRETVRGPEGLRVSRHIGRGGEETFVLNHFEPQPMTAEVAPFGGSRRATLYQPFEEPAGVALPATVTVPAKRFVIVACEQ